MPYEYRSAPNPYAESIGRLLAGRGDIEAQRAQAVAEAQSRAAIARGQAWGGAIQSVGQTLANLPVQIQQQKRAATQNELSTVQLGEAKRGVQARSVLGQVIGSTPHVDEDGVSLYDIPAISGKLEAAGFADHVGYVAAQLKGLNDAFRTERAAKLALVKQGAQSLLQTGGDPDLTMHFLDTLEKNRTFGKDEIDFYRQTIHKDPSKIPALLQNLAGPAKVTMAKPGEMPINEVTGAPAGPAVPDPAKAASEARMDAAQKETARHNAEMERIQGLTVGRQEAAQKETVRHNRVMEARPVPGANLNAPNDVRDAVTAMKEGTVPPQLPGRATKEYLAVMAEAKRQGYDLASAATDWAATQKHIATLNGSQQTRLNQSINQLPELLNSVDALASKWKGGKFPILNKANLALAKNGAYGREAASIATQLDAQIADVTADLGNVYMGGNSPTDHALDLASKALRADWDEKVLKDMVSLARQNVQTRQNSIRNTGVQGASANNPYVPHVNNDPLGILGGAK